MAKIPLRAYVKDIENLIDRGEIEQALAHARNILKYYPKHIDTYRLLGKAFLESNRLTEAADILQRVLSVFPDDFISQIGMSIIREGEKNYDAAIWHMERAYEVQPFNPAVQDELRRLYGQRDGVEPPRIRLTRGALVRMYDRGELYPQAIAETRAALAEDSQRIDLQVLLARLYYRSNQKVEAAEVCSSLLGKLPYCYEANQILAEVLPGTSRAEDARKFQQRIYALDPYQAFLSPTAPTVEQVPDQAVMVEQFVWDSAMIASQTPDWTRNLGVEWESKESEAEELPDWLGALKPETPEPTSRQPSEPQITAEELSGLFEEDGNQEPSDKLDVAAPTFTEFTPEQPANAEPAAPAEQEQDDLLPEWMRDAGWATTDRSADEIAKEQLQREAELGLDSGENLEAEQGEIPDWLKSIAPPEQPAQEEQRDDWLSSILETPPAEALQPVNGALASEDSIFPATDQEAEQGEVPDWLSGLDTGAAGTAATGAAAAGLPDWLNEEDQRDSSAEMPKGYPPSDAAGEDFSAAIIDWDSADKPASAEASDIPNWFSPADSSLTEPETGDTTATDWLRSFDAVEPQAAEQPQAESDDWLQALDRNDPASAPSAQVTNPASAETEDVPDWLQSLDSPTAQSETTATDWLQAAEDEADQPPANTPEWLQSIEANEAFRSEETGPNRVSTDWLKSFESGEAPEETANADWMQSFQTEETPAETAQPEREPAAEAEIPDWLQDHKPQQPSAEAGATEPTAEQTQPTAEQAMPDLSDMSMDEAMAWLESLAAKHGADEATLVTPPDQRLETPPDWVQQAVEGQPEADLEEAPTEQPSAAVELPAAEVQNEAAAVLPEQRDEFADLLPEEISQPSTIEPSTPAPVEAEQPAPDFDNMDEAMAWLESLAAKHGADEATLITPPEQRLENAPDWLQETADADASANAPAFAEPAEVPEWLQALNQQQEEAQPAADIPDWLTDALEEEQPSHAAETAEPAQPLSSSAIVDEMNASALAEEEQAPAGQSQPEAYEQPTAEQAMPDLSEMDMDSAMAWLESLAAKHGADEATLVTPPDQRLETPPDWIAQEISSAEESAAAAEGSAMFAADEPESVHSESAEQPAMPGEPASFAIFGEEEALEESGVADVPTQAAEEQAPETPSAYGFEALAAEQPPVETQPSADLAAAEGAMPDLSDMSMDEAMAWLESLAAKHGADEATLVTPPDQRLETPPDWVQQQAVNEETLAPSAEAEQAPAEPAESPVWDESPAVAELREEEEQLPNWLKEAISLEEGATEPAEQSPSETSDLPTVEAAAQEETPEQPAEPDFAWLEEDTVGEQTPVSPAEPIAQAAAPAETAAPDFDDMDAAMAWLESLAAKHGADEATLVTPPEQRLETPPDWVREAAEQSEELVTDAPPADQPEAETAVESQEQEQEPWQPAEIQVSETTPPDWLRQLGDEDTVEESSWPGAETTASDTSVIDQAVSEESTPTGEPSFWSTEAANYEQPDSTSQQDEDLPGWLRGIEQETDSETTVPAGTSSPETVPDWLKDMQDEVTFDNEALTTEAFSNEAFAAEQPPLDRPLPGEFASAWTPEIETDAGTPSSLKEAQNSLLHGKVDQALDVYARHIANGEHLAETIRGLRDALYRYPVDISIWQMLGDAYARNDQLQEALDAYTKAEELLR